MKTKGIALLSGSLFGFGLGLAGLLDPKRIIGFLDITGHWDPAMLVAMAGALVVSIITFQMVRPRCQKPFCAEAYQEPTAKQIDKPLILGAVLFGIGWGLAGICPGPAMASLAFLDGRFILFTASMFAGMYGFLLFNNSK